MKSVRTDESIKIEVEKTLEAARRIKRVEADPYLYEKITGRLNEIEQSPYAWLSGRGLKIGCTMIAILITFNIYVLFGGRDIGTNDTEYVHNVFEEISREFNTYTGPYNY